MLPDGKRKKKKKNNNVITESLGTVMKTAIIPTDSGRQSAIESATGMCSQSSLDLNLVQSRS